MGLFKRAGWRSGLTYRRVCDQCKTTVEYMDDKLDFRPWFADGFVYCPTCQKPLRHSESFAINAPYTCSEPAASNEAPTAGDKPAFCNQCGRKYAADDKFCPQCGNKR